MTEIASRLVVAMNPEPIEAALDTSIKSVGAMYSGLKPQHRAAFVPRLLREVYDGEAGLEHSAVVNVLAAVRAVIESRRSAVIQAAILALEEERQRII